jgi:hypothetical protein
MSDDEDKWPAKWCESEYTSADDHGRAIIFTGSGKCSDFQTLFGTTDVLFGDSIMIRATVIVSTL